MKTAIAAIAVAVAGSALAFAVPAQATGNGTWLVPDQLSPGTYQATSTGSFSGYVEVCADLNCQIDFDGSDSTGMIDNYVVDGPTYIVVPPNAAAVTTKRVQMVKVD